MPFVKMPFVKIDKTDVRFVPCATVEPAFGAIVAISAFSTAAMVAFFTTQGLTAGLAHGRILRSAGIGQATAIWMTRRLIVVGTEPFKGERGTA